MGCGCQTSSTCSARWRWSSPRRSAYVAYFIAYYAVTMGATWLLSAPRYLTAAFPLALSLAALTERKWADALATAACLAGLLYYLFAFLQRWSVY